MPRLSRAESQAQTRERLLESARRVFLRDGYVRTSLELIADEAGYSKGAIYSNFAGKEALFLELLKHKFVVDLNGLRQLVESIEAADELPAAVRRYYEGNAGILEFTLVTTEFLTQVDRGSVYAKECAALYAEQRKAIANIITTVSKRSGLVLPAPALELATAQIGLTLGLAVQRSTDPAAVTALQWARAIEIYLRGLIALASPHAGSGQSVRKSHTQRSRSV